jgi:hypothetical protein
MFFELHFYQRKTINISVEQKKNKIKVTKDDPPNSVVQQQEDKKKPKDDYRLRKYNDFETEVK